jgi:crotonobetaine/carnitine-CoA ligase
VNEFEVEEKMLRHPDVVSIAAVAVPSELGGGTEEEVKAVVMRGGSGVDEKELWGWTVSNMARFQVPIVVGFVVELKRTLRGKVEKGELNGGRRKILIVGKEL